MATATWRRALRERLAGLAQHHIPRPVTQLVRVLAVALVVEYLLVPQIAGFHENLHLLARANYAWLGAGLLLEIASLLVYGWLTLAVLPPAGRPGFWRVLRIDLSTLAVSHVVPAGSAVGLGLGYQLLTDAEVPSGDAVLAKAIQAVGSAVVLNAILWAALVVSIPVHGFSPVYGPVAVVGVVLLTAAGVAVVVLTRHEQRFASGLAGVLGRLPLLTRDSVEGAVRTTAEYLRRFFADRRLLRRVALIAAANWLLDAGSLWACVRAFGHVLGIGPLLVPYGIANVLAALPVTPAGLGVVEAFLIPALVGFGTPRGVAILGVLAWRAFNFLMPIPVGLAAYLSLPSSHRASPAAAEDEQKP